MKVLSRICPDIFKGRLAQIFLIVNLTLCGFVTEWKNVFSYSEKCGSENIKTVSNTNEISFVVYESSSPPPNPAEILIGFYHLISFPAVIGTQISIEDLKRTHPDWCVEKFDFLEVFLFIIFSSFYWFLFGYYIEIFYAKHRIKISNEKKILTIFSG